MAPQLIPLGPFELHHPIGEGGMGAVWKGVHPGQAVPVAVKVLTAGQARQPYFLDAFRNEVQAVAGLDHPGIVMVFDHGEVTLDAERASGGKLSAGSPYLVMELAGRGSLDRVTRVVDWSDLRSMLLSLLDALAHAHARGVIHRDLKPGNVLISGAGDLRPGIKLTDFGIAHAAERHKKAGNFEDVSGTPQYMAPEQFQGLWRDYGPWTDLYAFGILAWELVCGRLPFRGASLIDLAQAHLYFELPRLEPRVPVPPGIESWIQRLCQKDPLRRFACAADAAWELARLPDPPEAPAGAVADPSGSFFDASASFPQTLNFAAGPAQRGAEADLAAGPTEGAERAATIERPPAPLFPTSPMRSVAETPIWSPAVDVPPMPESWRYPTAPMPSMQLIGAGLGLYGLRTVPLVDREEERDAIWDALKVVRGARSAQAVAVHGAAGNGKSRLVEWMVERAQEVGASGVLQATHSPSANPADGIGRMCARHLRCVGLTRPEILERTEKLLREQGVTDPYEWNALTELMSPATREDLRKGARPIRFGSPTERYVLVRRLLDRASPERPVVVWLDDVQWGADALEFTDYLLKAQPVSPTSALLVLVTRDEALAERPLESALLDSVESQERMRRVAVGPLSRADRAALVRELLGLEGGVAAEVEERTGGNPLFAVQLVGDWVHRGILVPGRAGFELKRGENIRLPDDIHQVWAQRTARLLEEFPATARLSLQLAAVLGRDVDSGEWSAACAEAGVALPPTLLTSLLSNRLAVAAEGGWSFAHGMLRESLERQAREEGRWGELNWACASMLMRRYPREQHGVSERLGRHLLAAGKPEAALAPLLEGANERRDANEYRQALAIVEMREEALRGLGTPASDPRWGEGWLLKNLIHRLMGRLPEAAEWAERAEASAREYGWSKLLPEALLAIGQTLRHKGDSDRATAVLEQSRELFVAIGDRRGEANCLQGLGNAARLRGDLDRAGDLLEQARDMFDSLDQPRPVAHCYWGLAVIARHRGDNSGARMLLHSAISRYERFGDQLGVAYCLNMLADVDRFEGKLDAAAEGYRRAVLLHEAIGSGEAIISRMNLGLVLLQRRSYLDARPVLESSRRALERLGKLGFLPYVHVALLPCHAVTADWEGWDRSHGECERMLAQSPIIDEDIAWPAELAGELARAAGDPRRARSAWELARSQWAALRNMERAATVEALLASVEREPRA